MAGNSAGLMRAHRTITMAASDDTYTAAYMYASGAVPTATFVYPNDRYLAGDVAGFTKFTFQVSTTGTVTTPSITFYYTNDPVTASGLDSYGGTGRWIKMAAPSEQAGGGSVLNPVTGPTVYMQFSGPMLAYRIVNSAYSGGGSTIVDVLALP